MTTTTTNPDILKTFFDAITADNVETAVELLKLKEIDVESRNKNEFNQTALHIASKNGYLDLVQILNDEFKADINAKDINGDTPMKCAVDNGHVEVARCLEELKPKDFEYAKRILNSDLIEEIFQAVYSNNIEKVVSILDEKKIDVHVMDKSNYHRSLLNAAAGKGYLELVKLLVEKYDAEINFSDELGELPIHNAADNRFYEVTKYLAEHGSSNVEDVAEYLAVAEQRRASNN